MVGGTKTPSWSLVSLTLTFWLSWLMLIRLTPHEFTFRFNRRRSPMAAFQTLLGLVVQHSPTTYNQLYSVESTG